MGVVARSITIPNWSPTIGGSVVGRMENMPAGAVGVSWACPGASPHAFATSRASASAANFSK